MSSPGMATVSRAGYYEYIRSDAWRAVRRRYLQSKLPKHCAVCLKPWENSFVFHHKTYKNLGCERLMDIAPVCRPCHELIHKLDHHSKSMSPKPYGGLWGALKHARRVVNRPQQ